MTKSEVMDTRIGDEHVTPEQAANVNIGTYGLDDYVLSTGRKLEAELVTNNKIRIFDGVMVYCGIRDVIDAGDYHDVTIENGSQGMNRNDIIVRHFCIDATTGYGAAEFKAIKGTPVNGTAQDPEIEVTDLRAGDLEHDFKMYRARLEGLNVVAIEPLFEVLLPMSKLQEMLSELNSNKVPYGHFQCLWTGSLGTGKSATLPTGSDWEKYLLFGARTSDGVTMMIGMRTISDESSVAGTIRFVGAYSLSTSSAIFEASVVLSGSTITVNKVSAHVLVNGQAQGKELSLTSLFGLM